MSGPNEGEPAGRAAARPVEDKMAGPLETPFAAPVSAVRTLSDLYEERLLRIWRAASGREIDLGSDPDRATWEVIRGAVRGAGLLDDLRGVQLDRIESATDGDSLRGDVPTVMLLVSNVADVLSPFQRQRFIRDQLAPTVGRLEAEGASREEITDIVLRILRPAPVTGQVSGLLRFLLGYLTGQPEADRDANYYLSSAVIADRLREDAGDPAAGVAAAVAYSFVIRGMWRIAHGPEDAFTRLNRRVPSNNLTLLAELLERLAPGGGSAGQTLVVPRDSSVGPVLDDLVRLSIVTAETPVLAPADTAVLEKIGIETDHPDHLVAIMSAMASNADLLAQHDSARAVMHSLGGVAGAISGRVEVVPRQLFNAGVSLLRSPISPQDSWYRARLVMNLVGLCWGVQDFAERGLSGPASCAVNFVISSHQVINSENEDSPLRTALLHAVRAIAGWPEVAELPEHSARVETAVRNLRIGEVARTETRDLAQVIPVALHELAGAAIAEQAGERAWRQGLSRRELTSVTALTVDWVNRRLLDLPVDEVLASARGSLDGRLNGRDVFIRDYARYAMGQPEATGIGPLVTARVISHGEWIETVDGLLTDRGSVVPLLEELNL